MAGRFREWPIEYSQEFADWWAGLSATEQVCVGAVIDLLERHGPALGYPYSSSIHGSAFGEMRELRIQHAGRPWRILYAFDPRRVAVLLTGGIKSDDARWYRRMIRRADHLFRTHLGEL